ncbi:hypothetical protein [Luteipulveratus mongoliensis]|nr:hypothetical protein [Luteipulveratus mongoliensis]
MSTDPVHAKNAQIKRFFAIFFAICAVVAAINAFQADGGSRVVFGIGAVICLGLAAYLARSFTVFRRQEF